MESEFTSVSLEQREQYYKVWDITPRRSLDYTLANLWGWQEYFGLEWQFCNDLLWIRQTRPRNVWWAPLGDWRKADWAAILPKCVAGGERHFTRVPRELADLWRAALPGAVNAEEERGQWEYLYLQSDLASLSGNRYHRKRNQYNSYVKTYGEPDYKEISDDMVEDVLGCQDDWCQWHECEDSPSLQAENDAINRVLTHWDSFRNMCGGSLYVDGKMIAFSVGEALDSGNLGVHFEKGLNGYKGVYQAMNLQFSSHAGVGFKYMNRAQDMNEEGLRQAKMTYLPAGFLEKFKVTLSF